MDVVTSRVCRHCGEEKSLAEFHKGRLSKGSRTYTYCKACARSRAQESRAKKRAVLDAYKLAAGCADCGYDQHPAALDFDHRPDEEKEFTVGATITLSLNRLMAEIAKCDVVCANCHRIRTAMRGYFDRGTLVS